MTFEHGIDSCLSSRNSKRKPIKLNDKDNTVFFENMNSVGSYYKNDSLTMDNGHS